MRTPLYVYVPGVAFFIAVVIAMSQGALSLNLAIACSVVAGIADGVVTHLGNRRQLLIMRTANPWFPVMHLSFGLCVVFFAGTLALFVEPYDASFRPTGMVLVTFLLPSKAVMVVLNKRYFRSAPSLTPAEEEAVRKVQADDQAAIARRSGSA